MQADVGLFCVELRTAQWERMLRWYRDVLGLRCLIRVAEDRYAILGNEAGRLAIVGRDDPEPATRRWSLAIEVDDLAEVAERAAAFGTACETLTQSVEGFVECVLHDPDDNRVRVFAWSSR